MAPQHTEESVKTSSDFSRGSLCVLIGEQYLAHLLTKVFPLLFIHLISISSKILSLFHVAKGLCQEQDLSGPISLWDFIDFCDLRIPPLQSPHIRNLIAYMKEKRGEVFKKWLEGEDSVFVNEFILLLWERVYNKKRHEAPSH